ncbi:hypothetical protein [uncultured Helicobacter sp.]|uniref:hypothetical protein n=1 Tax=uncultured Helicobacter sp. TaxID=175537 RepID=UPI0026118340|nr:hypothetical protein [uncultured Helicobacter sp.]
MDKTKIYGKTKKQHFCLVAEDDLSGVWDLPTNEYQEISFIDNCNHKLEGNEIFFIKTDDDDIEPYLEHINQTSHCNNANNQDILELETLYIFKKENQKIHLYIQRITPSKILSKNLISANNLKIERNKNRLIIANITNVYWNQEQQKVYFTNFVDLENVFPKFSKYYREANTEDLNKFQSGEYTFLDIKFDMNTTLKQKTRLRKIAQIVDMLDEVKENLDEYLDYSKKYEIDILNNGQFTIKNTQDIDTLHHIVFGAFYTSEVGDKEQRIATAFRQTNLKNKNAK